MEEDIEVLAAFIGGLLMELDSEGRYLRILTGDSRLLARPASELVGHTVREVLGPTAEPFHSMFHRVTETGVAETCEYTLDVPAGRRTFRSEARRRMNEGGPSTVLLLVRDVTEQTELQAKLIAAERLAAVGTVAASVAHEVRQPLALATTSIEILARELDGDAPPNSRAGEALVHVRDALHRMTEIAGSVGMMASNRRSTRKTTTVRAPLDAALDLCASELRGHTNVRVDVDPKVLVAAPEVEVCQVLSNVILNAAQAMDAAHSSENAIHVSTSRAADFVRISVRDTGSGIAPHVQARIFDPFFTTKEEGRGTGLGLYLSKRIIERWGGRLSVKSESGAGTTVMIDLPPAKAQEARSSPPPPAVPQAPLRRLRILAIDDESRFLRSLQLVLEDRHDVTPCSSAAKALELVKADPKHFDAVLCDLSMPEVDGVAFYDEMEKLGVADRFILMTGGAQTARSHAFLASGRGVRLAKPFTPDELERILSSVTAATLRG